MMNKRKVGPLEVSPVGMGCMGLSHGYGKTPAEAYSIEALRKAYEFGCNFFDTAESYGMEQFYPGHNEELLGKALESVRQNVVIATKLHLSDDTAPDGEGLYQAVRSHLEASMKRLRTDYVDLYYLHRVNELIPLENVAAVMGRLIEAGLIRGWGLSQVSVPQIRAAHAVTALSAVQNLYSMVERDCEAEVIPFCLENDIAVVPFSPTSSGLLSGKLSGGTQYGFDDVRKFVPQLSADNLRANQPILDLLKRFAEEKNATCAQISLAWMLHKYPNVVPIPGSRNQERILENLGAWNVVLSEEEFSRLQTDLDACRVYGHRGCIETQQNGFGSNWKDEQR